jgi:nucleotide-binding universal stress UspA family protein
MLKKLLVMLDGSELAECVLSYVDTLGFCAEHADLVQVVPTPHGMPIKKSELPDFVADPNTGLRISTMSTSTPGGRRVPEDEGFWYQDKMMERAEAEARDYLIGIGKRLEDKGIKIEPVVLFGDPASEIVDYATKTNADLIVMSSHGRSGIGRWAFGSVADKVLRASPVPVMLIRAGMCPAI